MGLEEPIKYKWVPDEEDPHKATITIFDGTKEQRDLLFLRFRAMIQIHAAMLFEQHGFAESDRRKMIGLLFEDIERYLLEKP